MLVRLLATNPSELWTLEMVSTLQAVVNHSVQTAASNVRTYVSSVGCGAVSWNSVIQQQPMLSSYMRFTSMLTSRWISGASAKCTAFSIDSVLLEIDGERNIASPL